MIVRLPCFLALRSPLLIASRMEVNPIPVRALASSGDTESRSESGTFPFCPNSFITLAPYRLRATTVWLVSSPLSSTCDSGTGDNLTRLLGVAWYNASENVIIPHMMHLAVPKQNGCQKCVVQLDTKANERRGSASQFLRPYSGNSCD